MATAQYGMQERWPAAVLVATVAGFLSLAAWDAAASRHAGNYPIRITLPEAAAAAGGQAFMPSTKAVNAVQEEDESSPAAAILQGLGPGEAGTPVPGAARASPGFSYDPTDTSALYDVADSGGSTVEIVKPVQLNGASAGSASIRVSAGSALFIEGSEVARLFERAGRRDLAGQVRGSIGSARYIGFAEMRRQGFAIRYDPRCDCVVISI